MQFRHLINTLDYHHGQASRTIISGYPPILGSTMAEKSQYYNKKMAWIHRSLIREPRGHANMLGSILTEPVTPEAEFGVLFLHGEGQFEMCGDSAFATAFAVLENGIINPQEPITQFAMDTVAGLVSVTANINNGVVTQVALENVPAFYIGDFKIKLSSGSEILIELAYGGLNFAFIDCSQVNLSLKPENGKQLIAIGMETMEKVNALLSAHDNLKTRGLKIDLVTFYEKSEKSDYRVCNIYPPGRMGRTPSGTGISAHMALRYHKGPLEFNQDFIQESIVGTTFTGRLIDAFEEENCISVTPIVSTKSYLMGINQFIIDHEDPFKNGFLLNDS